MFDQYATGMAMRLSIEQHAKRRDLLAFSALPDAPVLPVRPPSRTRRATRRVSSLVRATFRTPRPAADRRRVATCPLSSC